MKTMLKRMTRKNLLSRVLGLTVAVSGLMLSTLGAKADPGDFVYYDQNTFGYKINNMPDIDQRRAFGPGVIGLPNNGSMYCVPTSCMNTLGYVANHGFPNVFPGPGAWWLNNFGQYNTMSNDQVLLGALMSTDPAKGTGGGPAVAATQSLLNPNLFLVDGIFALNFYAPTFSDMALMGIQGRLVDPVLGWYSNADTAFPHSRKGGHAVTMSEAYKPLFLGSNQIGIRDPARDTADLFTQSTYNTTMINTTDVFQIFDGFLRTQSRLEGYGSGYLDGAIVIKPKVAFSSINGTLSFLSPIALFNTENHKADNEFRTEDGSVVADLTLDPIAVNSPYIKAGVNGIWQMDHITGQSALLPDLGVGETGEVLPIAPLKIEMGGNDRQLFVLQSRILTRLSRTGKYETAVALRQPLVAIRWNAKMGQLQGLAADGTLYLYDINLKMVGVTQLPAAPTSPLTGLPVRVHLADDPLTGDLWMLCDGSVFAYHAQFRGNVVASISRVSLTGAVSPMALDLDEAGALFISDAGKIKAYDKTGRPLEGNPFAGMPGGNMLHIVRSFNNYDPTVHGTPAWYNVLPENAR